jgi:hypothetical protein
MLVLEAYTGLLVCKLLHVCCTPGLKLETFVVKVLDQLQSYAYWCIETNTELLLVHLTSYYEFWKPCASPACEPKQDLSSVLHQNIRNMFLYWYFKHSPNSYHILLCFTLYLLWCFTTCQLYYRRDIFLNVLWYSVTHHYFSIGSSVISRDTFPEKRSQFTVIL